MIARLNRCEPFYREWSASFQSEDPFEASQLLADNCFKCLANKNPINFILFNGDQRGVRVQGWLLERLSERWIAVHSSLKRLWIGRGPFNGRPTLFGH